jgi:hypothetical protein
MLLTVVSHMPRSSRTGLAAAVPHRPGTPGGAATATGAATGGW